MNSIKMKIVGFDRLKSAVQIKFCSDLAEKNIEEYPTYDFNVVETDNSVTQKQVLKALASTGWNIALQQEIAEQIAKNSKKVAEYESLISQEFLFSEDDLYAIEASEEQPTTEGLMII